ncbi:DUF1517 domain-containing protein [Planktothrix sp. FACHB-1355]|uniref:DUF1517 domain-containing protein n=1 Tax=Aerosakkonema funiforme FACHB-1375 TaxID=2949571 RepID=A0A926VF05_9CYAN|nr:MULTISPECIES: DUF1517 domain-containing protein [Oscillatoriales]MBD2181782.1 DUF1517 domain-containing protein [Aerosakkonema funiforme FACHB-1375]MBD3562908.1 DUF1517 domain-containing protein [Planktothrix sp. FACHB-1355]
MYKKLLSTIKPLLKPVLIAGLVLTLALGHADGALAARTGGRIGGGSFRVPSSTYTSPRTYAPPSGGYYYPGGGWGFPFLIPFFGIGGGFGGLFTILIFIAIANFLVQSFRRIGSGESTEMTYSSNPAVSVARLQVGLLANARGLQKELDRIAETADTGSAAGRAEVLQETTLALLRHPEYCVYAGAESQQTRLEAAEAQFNRLSLAERSKFTAETLSNVNNQLRQANSQIALPAGETSGELANLSEGPSQYIVVTLIAATLSKLQLPTINNSEDLRQALRQFGAIPADQLLAIEVLWAPQAEGDTLTSEDMIVEYPNLKLI